MSAALYARVQALAGLVAVEVAQGAQLLASRFVDGASRRVRSFSYVLGPELFLIHKVSLESLLQIAKGRLQGIGLCRIRSEVEGVTLHVAVLKTLQQDAVAQAHRSIEGAVRSQVQSVRAFGVM